MKRQIDNWFLLGDIHGSENPIRHAVDNRVEEIQVMAQEHSHQFTIGSQQPFYLWKLKIIFHK